MMKTTSDQPQLSADFDPRLLPPNGYRLQSDGVGDLDDLDDEDVDEEDDEEAEDDDEIVGPDGEHG